VPVKNLAVSSGGLIQSNQDAAVQYVSNTAFCIDAKNELFAEIAIK
jgi:hypothetical protein